MNDEQFEDLMSRWTGPLASQLRARDTSQREALARVAEDRDEYRRLACENFEILTQHRERADTAQAQLAEAVGLLKKLQPWITRLAEKNGDGDLAEAALLDDFLARHAQAEEHVCDKHGEDVCHDMGCPYHNAQAEQQEAQGEQAGMELVGYANFDRLDNMLDDRTATVFPDRSSYAGTPVYRPRAALATQPAEWVDPVALHPAENLYNQGFADGASEAKRLNAVRGAEHE